MDTNQVSLTRTTLNISTPTSQGINFSEGEIVKGVVQEVKPDGMVMITIKGQTIEAMTEVQVQPGQQLYLKVDDFRDGKTFLKVVTPQGMEVIENANLSANLLDMGVAAKEDNIAMARKLLDYNLPVTTSNLNEMAKGVKLLGAATPRSLEIVAFVMSRNLPVDAVTLKALEQYTLPGSNIAKLIQSVMQSLRQLGQAVETLPLFTTEAASSANINSSVIIDNTINNNTGTAAASANNSAGSSTIINTVTEQAPAAIGTIPAAISAEDGSTNSSAALLPVAAGSAEITNQEGGGTVKSPPANDPSTGANMAVDDGVSAEANTPRALGTSSAPTPASIPGASVQETEAPVPGNQTTGVSNQQQALPTVPLSPETTETAISQPGNNPVVTAEPPVQTNPSIVVADKETEGETLLPANSSGNNNVSEDAPGTPRQVSITGNTENSKTAPLLPNQSAAPGGTDDSLALSSGGNSKTTILLDNEDPSANTTNPPGATGQLPDGDELSDVAGKQTAVKKEDAGPPNKTIPGVVSDLLKSPENAPTDAARANTAPNQNAASSSKASDQLNLLRSLIEWMQVDGREPAHEISQKLERSVASDKDIIRGLTLLEDAIKSDNAQSKSPAVRELLQRIDNLEKELSGQKMFNYLSRTSNDNQFNFYYFSIPVKVGGEMHQCQLRLNKEGRQNLRNVDNLSFVVSLDTGKMGLVLFHVNWQRSRSLALQGVVESDSVAEHLTGNIGGLISKLKDLGYAVQDLGIKVSRETLDESLKVRVEEAPLSVRPLGIDITV